METSDSATPSSDDIVRTPDCVDSESGTDSKGEDIVLALESTGHKAVALPNGLVIGVSLKGIKNTRTVLADVVYVLDTRNRAMDRANLAIQSAVLSTVNRELDSVLRDVCNRELRYRKMRTVRGSITIPVLPFDSGRGFSAVRETRTTYAVYSGVRPSRDLTWFTPAGHIVDASEFAFIRRSDMRAHISDAESTISAEKWEYLRKSTRGWYGLLALLFSVAAGVGVLNALMTNASTLLLPAVTLILSGLASALYLRTGLSSARRFADALRVEDERVCRLAEGQLVQRALAENERLFRLVTELNFVVSSLAAEAASAFSEGDTLTAIARAAAVIDECVRLSPQRDTSIDMDAGLSAFLGLFHALGALAEEDEKRLALAYVALSRGDDKKVSPEHLLEYLTVLNHALYRSGLLSPTAKDSIDELLNRKAAKSALESLERELGQPDIVPMSEGSGPHRDTEVSTEELSLAEEIAGKSPQYTVKDTGTTPPPAAVVPAEVAHQADTVKSSQAVESTVPIVDEVDGARPETRVRNGVLTSDQVRARSMASKGPRRQQSSSRSPRRTEAEPVGT
ncbi:MAG: hypothetical protein HXY34_05670 [Candidatus Thorarchaeota archaeon]|nr:hypothetical protein [Candidatus Thorarchaeota archaeon]